MSLHRTLTGTFIVAALALGACRRNQEAAPAPAPAAPTPQPAAAAAPNALAQPAVMPANAAAVPGAAAAPAVGAAAAPAAGASQLSLSAAPNFGVRQIAPGFVPDPIDVPVVSGGNINATNLSLGAGCGGHVSAQPDFNIQLSGTSPHLRIYVTAQEDTTLVINDAQGNWHCNDDSYDGTNPTVDLTNVAPGLINVWVGSYNAGTQARGTLHITELDSNHP